MTPNISGSGLCGPTAFHNRKGRAGAECPFKVRRDGKEGAGKGWGHLS